MDRTGADSVLPFKSKSNSFDFQNIKITFSTVYNNGYKYTETLYKDGVQVATYTSNNQPAISIKYSSNDDYKNNYVLRADSVRVYAGSASLYQTSLNLYINDNLVSTTKLPNGEVTSGELLFTIN